MDSLEATFNVIVGCAINWGVLFGVYGQPATATVVTLTMIALTWMRSYLIRKAFRKHFE